MLIASDINNLHTCFVNATIANSLKPELLAAVISVEGGRPGAVSVNKNGTHDLGIMQINTGAWLPLISKTFFNNQDDKAYNALKDNGCFNIYIGSWILAHSIRKEKGDIWEGVGRYHSATPKYKYRYIEKVKKVYNKHALKTGS